MSARPNLPGFYWDETKNRYFPLSSQPKPKPPPRGYLSTLPSQVNFEKDSTKKPRKPLWRVTEESRLTCFPWRRDQAHHQHLANHYSNAIQVKYPPLQDLGKVTAFKAHIHNGETYCILGNEDGRVFLKTPPDSPFTPEPRTTSDVDVRGQKIGTSEVTSISCSEMTCASTLFGPDTKIHIQHIGSSGSPPLPYVFTARGVHDVRASCLSKQLVIGAKGEIAFISFETNNMRTLKLHSDVFSLSQEAETTYAGTRNGSLCRFDGRTDIRTSNTKKLRVNIGPGLMSPILYLQTLSSSQMLVGQMNGKLAIHDLRFSTGNPIVTFAGHVNSCTQRLGIAVDPDENFLFAVGEDCRVRGWSIHDGTPLRPNETVPDPIFQTLDQCGAKLLDQIYPCPVEVLQVVDEGRNLCVWAGCGRRMLRYALAVP